MTIPAALVLAWIRICALGYGVEPEFAMAVAKVESNLQCGPLGRKGTYLGPMGIHKNFRRQWAVDDPRINVLVGVKALRGRDHRRVLRRYNAGFDEAYWRAVQQARRQYLKENKYASLHLPMR